MESGPPAGLSRVVHQVWQGPLKKRSLAALSLRLSRVIGVGRWVVLGGVGLAAASDRADVGKLAAGPHEFGDPVLGPVRGHPFEGLPSPLVFLVGGA